MNYIPDMDVFGTTCYSSNKLK